MLVKVNRMVRIVLFVLLIVVVVGEQMKMIDDHNVIRIVSEAENEYTLLLLCDDQ